MSEPEGEDELRDDELSGSIPMLDSTEAYLKELERIFRENLGALSLVRGNLLIHVFGVATRMFVTSGPRQGIHEEPTDDPVHFTFAVRQGALLQLLEEDASHPFDLGAAKAEGAIFVEGDPAVYQRFMGLDKKKKNLLSIRNLE
ncbi:MAG: hypothetical protein IPG45_21875 [Deltaproteobacteria bacterium]|nr:hypothetical protein [Deltaproteobacteria bacterium]